MNLTWLIPILGGALRNISGWVTSSLEDGKITKYEWALLGKTILEIVILSISAYYGLKTDFLESTGIAVLISYGISALKKVGKK